MKTKSDSQLAEQYHCDERTIRRWRKKRAPLHSVPAMRTWLAAQREVPAGTLGWLTEHQAIERSKVLKSALATKLPRGAAAGLRRLEEAEAAEFAALQSALETGNAAEIKLHRDAWLRIGDSLRRYDLAIEATRRDSGELIPREELENLARWFGQQLNWGLKTYDHLCPLLCGLNDPREVHRILKKWIEGIRLQAVAHFGLGADYSPLRFEKGVLKAFVDGITLMDSYQKCWVEHHGEFCQQMFNALAIKDAEEARAEVDKAGKAHLEKYEAAIAKLNADSPTAFYEKNLRERAEQKGDS